MKKDIHPKKNIVTVLIAGKAKFTVFSKYDKPINLSSGLDSHNAWSNQIVINTSHDKKLKKLDGIYSFTK